MKIAVISDIHDNFHNLFKTLDDLQNRSVEQILCLGDLINPGIAKVLAHYSLPTTLIWGNNDGDQVEITKCASKSGSKLTVSASTYDFLVIDDKRIFITHYFDLAEPMARSGDFDVVFYGHDHLHDIRQLSDCLVVNPGEIAASKTGKCTYALYDTINGECTLIQPEGCVSLKTAYSDEQLGAYVGKFSKRSQTAYNQNEK